MGRHHKKKASKGKQVSRIRCSEIPRCEPALLIAEDIEKLGEIKPDRSQPSRGGTLRFYEYTVFPRMGARA